MSNLSAEQQRMLQGGEQSPCFKATFEGAMATLKAAAPSINETIRIAIAAQIGRKVDAWYREHKHD